MQCHLVSCLEKVFPDTGAAHDGLEPLVALRGEAVAFQCALCSEEHTYLWPTLEGALPGRVTMRKVDSVPVRHARTQESSDAGYERTSAGFYPDLLSPLQGGLTCPAGCWQALLIEIHVAEDAPAGRHQLALHLQKEGGETHTLHTALTVLPASLPPQEMAHTEWFHADCLADYYQVPVFSERHWEILGHFMQCAAERGCTMLLTPHFTPALDTRIGGERTTVQLVEVEKTENGYRFGFDKLRRWIDLAFEKGFSQIEFSHLFTQWGAAAAPKVMGTENGITKRLFGWDTPATKGEYPVFLQSYLPALTEKLREWGVDKRCCFHVSDEPSADQLDRYLAAKELVAPLLKGYSIMDALSDLALVEACQVSPPIACVHHLDSFLAAGISPLWGYTCCVPATGYTNRFQFMPLSRVRCMGMQWWKYDLRGFLHWGYNFYNTAHSVSPINPFLDCESGGIFPAGDPFLVYPGQDGRPLESLRLLALHYAMQDARALCLLSALIGREKTVAILDENAPLTLTAFPADGPALLSLRGRINTAIAAALNAQNP